MSADENWQTVDRDIIATCSPEKFKSAFIEWWGESEHIGWESFTDADINSFEELMHDFAMFIKTAPAEEVSGFISFGSHVIDLSKGLPIK